MVILYNNFHSTLPLSQVSAPVARKEPPPYGQRKGWIPRSLDDYGDGGAFPEIMVAQYPLNMGAKSNIKGEVGRFV